jgi:hypothetical protein
VLTPDTPLTQFCRNILMPRQLIISQASIAATHMNFFERLKEMMLAIGKEVDIPIEIADQSFSKRR